MKKTNLLVLAFLTVFSVRVVAMESDHDAEDSDFDEFDLLVHEKDEDTPTLKQMRDTLSGKSQDEKLAKRIKEKDKKLIGSLFIENASLFQITVKERYEEEKLVEWIEPGMNFLSRSIFEHIKQGGMLFTNPCIKKKEFEGRNKRHWCFQLEKKDGTPKEIAIPFKMIKEILLTSHPYGGNLGFKKIGEKNHKDMQFVITARLKKDKRGRIIWRFNKDLTLSKAILVFMAENYCLENNKPFDLNNKMDVLKILPQSFSKIFELLPEAKRDLMISHGTIVSPKATVLFSKKKIDKERW